MRIRRLWTSVCQQFRPQETLARSHYGQALHLPRGRLRQVLHAPVVATQARQDSRPHAATRPGPRGRRVRRRRLGRRRRHGRRRVRRRRLDLRRRSAISRKTRPDVHRPPKIPSDETRPRQGSTVSQSIRSRVAAKPETDWRRWSRTTSGLFEHRRLVCLSAGSSDFRFWRT